MKRILLLTLASIFSLQACQNTQQGSTDSETTDLFSPIPMPSTLANGMSFPTDSSTIKDWVCQSVALDSLEANQSIINHGWAIWQALTERTGETYNAQTLRRFETWYTPEDIKRALSHQSNDPNFQLTDLQRNTGRFQRQNQHPGQNEAVQNSPLDVIGFVKYDPSGAEHIYQNKLFLLSTLERLKRPNEIGNVPNFPNSAVSIKPVFQILPFNRSLGSYTGSYMKVWPGNDGNSARSFGEQAWPADSRVFITGDVSRETTFRGTTVIPLQDIIYFRIDQSQADAYNRINKANTARADDIAVLQGMHVTTRELTRWTWQTFWWSRQSDYPNSPSTPVTAFLRNELPLDRASKHYAMAIAYNMITPSSNPNRDCIQQSRQEESSLFAYNPYLEADFGQRTFASGNADVLSAYFQDSSHLKIGLKFNNYGMQTNCMSCHSQARFINERISTAPHGRGHRYIANSYVDMNAPYFYNNVKLDFTWSIQGNIIRDDELASIKEFVENQ